MFKAVCKLGLEGLFQRSSMRPIAVWAFEDLDRCTGGILPVLCAGQVQNMQRDEPRKLILLIRRFDNLDKVLMILLHLFCTVP
jgi:hypothetical protein